MKNLTVRSRGISTRQRVTEINQTIRGWVNYFRLGNMKKFLMGIDSNTRMRLRMCIWKSWKTPQKRRKSLIILGMHPNEAYKNSYSSKSYARIASSWVLTTTIKNESLKRFGLLSASEHYQKVHVK